ncbi:MAG: hypothetical protein GC145_00505 [Caulobacter sp.]|nr:hypothetical protein [Caulobacter sp.]
MPASSPDEAGRPGVILRVVPPPPPEPPPRRTPPWRDLLAAAGLAAAGLWLAVAIVTGALADARVDHNPAAALKLKPDHAGALARAAEKRLEAGRIDAAGLAAVKREARRALALDPTQSSAFRSLAFAAGQEGDAADQRRLMTIAGDRMKRDLPANLWLISDRLKSGRLAEAVQRADGLMRAWPVTMRTTLGRQLVAVAAAQGGAPVVAALLDSEPPWRLSFLSNMAKDDINPGAAMALYTAMSSGRHPPSELETSFLVGRLVRDGLFQEAFLIWAQLLPPEGISNLADPYDGGFEGLPGAPPFNWRLFERPGTVAEIAPAPNGEGHALYLRFTDAPRPGVLARELLALTPGRQVLTGRWRSAGLSAGRPLSWTVRCAERGARLVGESPPLSVAGDWTAFTFPIDVPEDCKAQWLSLSPTGRGRMNGEAWFDDLKISR